MNTTEELDIITRMRGEVMGRKDLTGENLFLAWGYPTAIVLLLEFAALMIWNEDYERTRRRTLDENVILMMWIFIGFASSAQRNRPYCALFCLCFFPAWEYFAP